MKENSIKDSIDRRLSQEKEEFKKQKQKKNILMPKLILVLLLGGVVIAVKIIGGIYSHSLAIISDAVHMFTDFFAFLIAIIAVWISDFPANNLHSFGYHRAGIVGALVSIILVWVLNCFLIYYAIERIMDLSLVSIHAKIMFYISCFGLAVNLSMIYILRSKNCFGRGFLNNMCKRKREKRINYSNQSVQDINKVNEDLSNNLLEDNDDKFNQNCNDPSYESNIFEEKNQIQKEVSLNKEKTFTVHSLRDFHKTHNQIFSSEKGNSMIVRATILHILGDIFQSLITIVGSLLIWEFPEKAKLADPILTFIFVFIVFVPSISIVVECCSVLMEGTPRGFNTIEFEEQVKQIPDVCEIHDLHIWCPDIGRKAMSVHILSNPNKCGQVLRKVTALCRANGIYHSTIQVETTQDKEDQNYIDCHHQMH